VTAAFHWSKWAFFLPVSGLAAQLWSADLVISEPRDVGSLGFGVIAVCNAAAPSDPDPGARVTDAIASRMIREFLP
jgi:hypothetical protein